MKNWFKLNLNSKRFKVLATATTLSILLLVGVAVAQTLRTKNQSASTFIPEDLQTATLKNQSDFSIKIEQDDDAPLKILSASVKTIPANEYRRLTSKETPLTEVVSLPQVNFQNVSDKTVTGITLFISDKAANTKRGFYIKEQSIKPGQTFTILPENLVRIENNPAENPKFWLDAVDKSQIGVRVVVFFEDGSMWANQNQRY